MELHRPVRQRVAVREVVHGDSAHRALSGVQEESENVDEEDVPAESPRVHYDGPPDRLWVARRLVSGALDHADPPQGSVESAAVLHPSEEDVGDASTRDLSHLPRRVRRGAARAQGHRDAVLISIQVRPVGPAPQPHQRAVSEVVRSALQRLWPSSEDREGSRRRGGRRGRRGLRLIGYSGRGQGQFDFKAPRASGSTGRGLLGS